MWFVASGLASGLDGAPLLRLFLIASAVGTVCGALMAVRFWRWSRPLEKPETLRDGVMFAVQAPRQARDAAALFLGAGVVVDLILWRLLVPGFSLGNVVSFLLAGVTVVSMATFLASFYVRLSVRRMIAGALDEGLPPEEAFAAL